MFTVSTKLNKNLNEKLMTTKKVAEVLKTTKDVILANGKKCFPNKVIEHGKPTFWSNAEITIILDYMKTHSSNNRSVELNSTVENTITDLTPALKIKKAFDLMQEGYEEELAILKAKNAELQPKADCYDNFLARDKFCNFRDSANYFGISQKELMSFLKSKYIYKNSIGEYRAYSEYSEYFTLRPFDKGKDKVKRFRVFWTIFQKIYRLVYISAVGSEYKIPSLAENCVKNYTNKIDSLEQTSN